MSELKATTVYDAYWKANSVGERTGILVYLKSEADKVIALLTDKANYNEEGYKIKNQELADACRFYEDEIRHHKYKRCLAMARWCSAELGMLVSTWESKIKHYKRWRKRWLELAEKFKEAK